MTCIVCETVRFEVNNKISLLGVFGFLPHIELTLEDITQPLAQLSFVVATGPGAEGNPQNIAFAIRRRDNATIIAEHEFQWKGVFKREMTTNLTVTFQAITFTKAGEFDFAVSLDRRIFYTSSFRVRSANPGELA
jgi:hypothetical protein